MACDFTLQRKWNYLLRSINEISFGKVFFNLCFILLSKWYYFFKVIRNILGVTSVEDSRWAVQFSAMRHTCFLLIYRHHWIKKIPSRSLLIYIVLFISVNSNLSFRVLVARIFKIFSANKEEGAVSSGNEQNSTTQKGRIGWSSGFSLREYPVMVSHPSPSFSVFDVVLSYTCIKFLNLLNTYYYNSAPYSASYSGLLRLKYHQSCISLHLL